MFATWRLPVGFVKLFGPGDRLMNVGPIGECLSICGTVDWLVLALASDSGKCQWVRAGVVVRVFSRWCPFSIRYVRRPMNYVVIRRRMRAGMGPSGISVNGVAIGKSSLQEWISTARTIVASASVASSMAK